MRLRRIQLFLFLTATASVLAANAPVGAPVALLHEVELRPTTVMLSDLLPSQASDTLREASSEVSLGNTPEPGNVRLVSRQEIQHDLIDHPDLLASLQIPESVTVHRFYRELSRAELIAAIQAAVDPSVIVEASLASFELLAPVYVTTDDPGLRVTHIESDPLHQQTRFRLWTSNEPANLPFYVTVMGNLKLAARTTQVGPIKGNVAGFAPRSEALVKPGQPVRLVIQGEDYRITTTVMPLEQGMMGQEIRVRDPLTKRIFQAQVAGPGLLNGTL